MSFTTPTLSQLVNQVGADLDARLPGADSRLRHSVIGAVAWAWAFALFGAYGFLGWISRQVLPDTADDEQLDRHASLWGLTRKSAAKAVATATLNGVAAAPVPIGSRLQRNDGVEYETLAGTAIGGGGTVVVDVRAVLGGKAGNAASGTLLNFTTPVAGVQAGATLASDAVGGSDRESDAALRARVLERLRQPPQGGAAHDYVRWGKEVPGVTRAWVREAWQGLGSVGVLFVCDDRVDIFPLAADVEAVQDYIDASHRRPVTAEVFVMAPAAKPIAMTIHVSPDTPDVRAAVAAELTDMFRREAEPGGTTLLSHIREAVSAAAGEFDNAVTVPAGNVTSAAHEIATLGAITWA